jgi:hypothetical protein
MTIPRTSGGEADEHNDLAMIVEIGDAGHDQR